jgi:hypothetical protein
MRCRGKTHAARVRSDVLISQDFRRSDTVGEHPVWSKNACGIARVVFQEPTEPCTTVYRASMLRVLADDRQKQPGALALMIPLVMNMRDLLRQRMAERRFSTEDHPCETLLFA